VTALLDRLNRICRTEGCDRQAIRDGAFCADCTNQLWSTGRPPRVAARWVELAKEREHGLARVLSGDRL
jgi:hypothetical protein